MSAENTGLLERTLRRFRRAWPGVDPQQASQMDNLSKSLPDAELQYVRDRIDDCLQARGGEASSRVRAAALGEAYLLLDDTGRARFLKLLANEYGVDSVHVDALIDARSKTTDDAQRRKANRVLAAALVAARVRLLRQFNSLNDGVKFLVDMRADLLRFARDDRGLGPLEEDLHELLASWFDIGFLELRRITWHTPAALLEKLIEYEAVHAIRSWDDLKHRLEVDRRCYAFFHPNMPDEPLIFVQVALVDEMSDSIQSLLDENAPIGDADTAKAAIFYSISNCQRGLAGVSFGDFLIKRVANSLTRELPNLKTFATLSPIPGFRRWLEQSLDKGGITLTDAEQDAVQALPRAGVEAARLTDVISAAGWWQDPVTVETLQPILTRLCAHYLLNAKRGARALNPVAHFHLTNGARVERLNWLGDTSENGLTQSLGLMVNYQYRLTEIERNHELYSAQGKVNAAAAIAKLAKTPAT